MFFILFAVFVIFGADSFSAGKFAVLKDYEYLLKNGREVTGTVTAADERYEFSSQHANSYYYYLIYEYRALCPAPLCSINRSLSALYISAVFVFGFFEVKHKSNR